MKPSKTICWNSNVIQTLELVLKKDRPPNQLRFIIVALPRSSLFTHCWTIWARYLPLFPLNRLWLGRIATPKKIRKSWKIWNGDFVSSNYHPGNTVSVYTMPTPSFPRNQQWFPQFQPFSCQWILFFDRGSIWYHCILMSILLVCHLRWKLVETLYNIIYIYYIYLLNISG